MTTRLVVRAAVLSLLVVVTAVLSGCYSGTTRVTYYEPVTSEPPPEPMIEVIPYAPGPNYVWQPGYWYWAGNGYVWMPGRYSVAPTNHVWVRTGYVYSGGRYTYVRGYWAPSSYRVHHHYVHTYPAPRRGSSYRAIPRGGRRGR